MLRIPWCRRKTCVRCPVGQVDRCRHRRVSPVHNARRWRVRVSLRALFVSRDDSSPETELCLAYQLFGVPNTQHETTPDHGARSLPPHEKRCLRMWATTTAPRSSPSSIG